MDLRFPETYFLPGKWMLSAHSWEGELAGGVMQNRRKTVIKNVLIDAWLHETSHESRVLMLTDLEASLADFTFPNHKPHP